MKTKFFLSLGALAVSFLLWAPPVRTQESNPSPGQSTAPKLSEGETKALAAINAAPDAAAKLTAAEGFVKKYPKSPIRLRLAEQLAGEISKVPDTTQKLALAERFQQSFDAAKEQAAIQAVMMDAYVSANRVDDSFGLASSMLAKDPEDLHVLVQMTLTGTEEAKRRNGKYVPQSMQYGQKAIELIEANEKPASMDEATWANHKSMLPQLYQDTAILSMVSGNPGEAKNRLSKAIALNPTDPSNYAFTGYLINDEYVQLATTYKAMPEGKPKEETLSKLQAMLDSIIDAYAHTIALATGRTEYQPLVQQVLPDLTSYYKFRHNQSTDGLQQLIDKYKPAKQP